MTVDIFIRPATLEDYPFYCQLYPEIGTDHPPVPVEAWTKYEMPKMSIIMQDTTSVAYVWAMGIGKNYYLVHLVVAHEYRRKGIGTATLRLVKKMAREKGFETWGLHCDVTHEIPYKMYIKAGLRPNGKGFYMHMPDESINSLPSVPNQCSLVIAPDKSTWTDLENASGIMNGEIEAWVKSEWHPAGFIRHQQKCHSICHLWSSNKIFAWFVC